MAKSNLKDQLKHFNVKTQIETDCPYLYGDPVLLERVLYNLIDNATKYCPEGSIILIEAKKRNDKVIVSVSDDGPGLPKMIRRKAYLIRSDAVRKKVRSSVLAWD